MNTYKYLQLLQGDNQIVMTCKGIAIVNDLDLLFDSAYPIVNLAGFHLTGVGPRGFCWWLKDFTSVLVSREVSNRMLSVMQNPTNIANLPKGIIITFPDKNDKTGSKQINKFVSLGNINMIDAPKFENK